MAVTDKAIGGAAAGSSFGPWGAVVGGVLGGIAGAADSGGQSQTTSRSLAPETELERLARLNITQGFGDLNRIQNQDFAKANQASQAYGNLLQQYSSSGGMPTAADLAQGSAFAKQALAPQQAQIDLSMRQSTEAARQQAGLMGRSANDFALNTKLGAQRNDLMNQLGAQQSAMGLDFANQFNQGRLNYSGQFAQLQQGLATQAMNNRMAIMGLGNQIQSAGQNFRLGSATQTTSTPGTSGGLMGALTGAFSGATGGMQVANLYNASQFGFPQQNNAASTTATPSPMSAPAPVANTFRAPASQMQQQPAISSNYAAPSAPVANPFPAFAQPVPQTPWSFNATNPYGR